MDVTADGELIDSGARACASWSSRAAAGSRHRPALRRLIAGGSGFRRPTSSSFTPAGLRCAAWPPGRGLPDDGIGRAWFADVAVSADAVVAATATRRPLGVGLESATPARRGMDGRRSMRASSRRSPSLDLARRPLVRATLWARKSACSVRSATPDSSSPRGWPSRRPVATRSRPGRALRSRVRLRVARHPVPRRAGTRQSRRVGRRSR